MGFFEGLGGKAAATAAVSAVSGTTKEKTEEQETVHVSSDLKAEKFRMQVRKIAVLIDGEEPAQSSNNRASILDLIFGNRDELEPFTQIILDEYNKRAYCSFENINNFELYVYKGFGEPITRIPEFVRIVHSNSAYDKIPYKTVLWALITLTIERKNYENNLSAICDLAEILNITEDEMRGLVALTCLLLDTDISKEDRKYAAKAVAKFGPLSNLKNILTE